MTPFWNGIDGWVVFQFSDELVVGRSATDVLLFAAPIGGDLHGINRAALLHGDDLVGGDAASPALDQHRCMLLWEFELRDKSRLDVFRKPCRIRLPPLGFDEGVCGVNLRLDESDLFCRGDI